MGFRQIEFKFNKAGVRFADAISVLEDDLALTNIDLDCDEEDRWITLGIDSLHRFVVVVWTLRGEIVRIISARHATAKERLTYEELNET